LIKNLRFAVFTNPVSFEALASGVSIWNVGYESWSLRYSTVKTARF